MSTTTPSHPSIRSTAPSGNTSPSNDRKASKNSPAPSGTRSGASGTPNRQIAARTTVTSSFSRASRSQRPLEQRAQREQMNTESIQELRELVNAQEAELFRLKAETQDTEAALAESIQEVQILRQDLEDARLAQHRLEDELELRREELETMHNQVREIHKSKLELQRLAEGEQQRLLKEKEAVVRSNSELSAQLKALRNNLQLDRPRDISPSSNDQERTDAAEYISFAAAIREKDRLIDSLRLELADLEVRLAEHSSAALLRTRQVEDTLLQVKLENIRLSENVESYQMLLQDRILKGEYPIMSLEGVPEGDEANSIRSNSPSHDDGKSKSASLATELEEAETNATTSKIKALQAEIRHLKDSNKAMSLYISEIIGKLLQTQGFEQVLEKDGNKNLPTPPIPDRRPSQPKAITENSPRRPLLSDNPAKRITSDAGISGGLSRAFSFRKKQESANSAPNLRPLKLVEEQQPQAFLRSDGTMSHTRSRIYSDDSEETNENKAAKRASWVPGWFVKAGVLQADEK